MYEGNYTVQDYATAISDQPVGRDIMVKNIGTTTVYLSTYPGPVNTTGLELAPADTKVWNAGDALYASSTTGTTGKLNVSLNSGALVSPSDIASRISITGAPPIDRPMELYSATVAQDGTSVFSSAIDVSSFNTLQWRFRGVDPATLTAPTDQILVGVYWYDSTLTTVLAVDVVNLIGDNNNFTFFEFSYGRWAAKGAYAVFVIQTPNRPGGTVQLLVTGSLKTQRQMSWLMNGYYGNSGGSVSSYGLDRFAAVYTPAAMASGVSAIEWIPVRSGLCTVLFSYNATVPANGLDFLIQDLYNVPIAGFRAVGGGAARYSDSVTFYMPDKPIHIFMRNRGPAATTVVMSTTFTWEIE